LDQFKEDVEWAKWFISDAGNRLIGRMASPVPEEDIAVFHHYLSNAMPPYFEVGVLWGGSMVIAGQAIPTGHLYGIDPFWGYCRPGAVDPYVRDNPGEGLIPTQAVAEQNLKEYGIFERTTLFKGLHPPLPEELADSHFGAIFIDGDHQTKSVLADWNELKYYSAGIVIFHDLHHKTVASAWEKVKNDPMVEEVLYEGGKGKFSRMGVVSVRQELT
jgi:hypothetical protein